MEYTFIGGSDGPTTVFIAGRIGGGIEWLNVFGLVMVVLLLIPNIVYAIKEKDAQNLCANKTMNIIEQLGRYASMFLMTFNIGILEYKNAFVQQWMIVYWIVDCIIMLTYWIGWFFCFKKKTMANSMLLAILPTCLFIISGVLSMHLLLIVSGLVFGIGHVYITYTNAKLQNA